MGDAVEGFRPHTVASTSQTAYDELSLKEMMKGGMTEKQMQDEIMGYARQVVASVTQMGNRGHFGSLTKLHRGRP
jgi:hypothetical protein